MRKALVIGATLGMLAAVLGVAEASDDDEKTIHLRGKETGFHELDLGEKGPSVFDQSIFTGDLFDRGGNKVGHEVGQCVAVTPVAFDPPSGEVVCTTSVVLERGQIVFSGLFQVADLLPPGEFWTPVVGGTGEYRDAAGQGFVKELPGGWELTIHLE